jgi:hypothetical protein
VTPRELYDLARREVARSTAVDPEAISAAIIRTLPGSEIKAALRISLPFIVRRVIATAATHGAGGDATHAPAHADPLKQQVCVAPGQWKRLADCTAAELASMAAFRRQVAEEHLAQAHHYDRLAEALENAGLPTVNHLSVRVLTLVT